MPKPGVVSVDVPQDLSHVFELLDVLVNHEPFTHHLVRDRELSGPDRGVGADAQVHVRTFDVRDDIEVLEAAPPERIVERNHAHKAGGVGEGTYTHDFRETRCAPWR